jgi:hypothetical protein
MKRELRERLLEEIALAESSTRNIA